MMRAITSFFPKAGAGSDSGETQSVFEDLDEPSERLDNFRGPLFLWVYRKGYDTVGSCVCMTAVIPCVCMTAVIVLL